MKVLFSFLVAIFVLSGCSTLQVDVDYDDSFDFKSQKTFVVVQSGRESSNGLFNDRVVDALNVDLKSKDYQEVSKRGADLVFVFHADVESKSDIRTDYQMMGYRGYRYSGMMMSTTSSYDYKEGTLVVDALNPKTQKIVWRAIATKEIRKYDTPQERTEAVNRVIKKLMEKFPTKI